MRSPMKIPQCIFNRFFNFSNDECDRLVTDALSQGTKTTVDLVSATKLSLGRVYPTLNRLEKQGLIWSEWSEASAQRLSGNRRRFFYLK